MIGLVFHKRWQVVSLLDGPSRISGQGHVTQTQDAKDQKERRGETLERLHESLTSSSVSPSSAAGSLFIYLFTQQIFAQCLLCARSVFWSGNISEKTRPCCPQGLTFQHPFEFNPVCQLPASELPPTSYPQNFVVMIPSKLEFKTSMGLLGLGFRPSGQESGQARAAAPCFPLLPWGAERIQKLLTQAALLQCVSGIRSHTDQETTSSSL